MSAIEDKEESNASGEVIQQSPSESHALINNLNDDCLAKIFKYLPWEQRLEIETGGDSIISMTKGSRRQSQETIIDNCICLLMFSSELLHLEDICMIIYRSWDIHEKLLFKYYLVCKRWREASKSAWDDMHALKFSGESPDMKKLPLRLRNTKDIGRILMRCGAYVIKLHFGQPCRNIILSIVAQYCNNLRELVVQFQYHDINWSLILPYLERLESIKVLQNFEIHRHHFVMRSIQAFRNLKCLRHLKLPSFVLDPEMIDAIAQKHNLIHLDLVSCKIGGSITPLLHLENLKHLSLQSITTVDDNFVIQLVDSCKHLTYLNLSFCTQISDVGIASLQRLSNLEELDVAHLHRITDGPLGAMYKLRKLDCCSCRNVFDRGIIRLIRNAPQLEYLDVIGTKVTETVIVEALKVTRERSSLPLDLRVDPALMGNRSQEAYMVHCPLLHIKRGPCFR